MINVQRQSAFSLVEVTLAIGIVSFALLAILALVPVGMKSGSEAIDATHTSLIGQDAQNRVRSTVTNTTFASANDISSAWFYDRDGGFVGTAITFNAFYRADATIHKDWGVNASPSNVDATLLRPVTVQVRWPVNTSNGNPLGNNETSFTFYVRRP